ncbi:hypothetical protein [Paenibacillus sp. SN-8-1]|uniref:hypothetical protein n=1 Tax=Paenibacillus sp. SN-8-1 TaxID=3435409 RepID=UPI003D9A70FE
MRGIRFFFRSAVIILTISVVIGCTPVDNPTEAEADGLRTPAQEQHTENKNAGQADSQSNKGIYDIREVGQVQIQDHNQISWQEDNVSLSAVMVQPNQTGASSVIGSIKVSNGDLAYPIDLEQAPISISSVSLSSDHQYLAMHLKYTEGHQLVIVNMAAGDHYSLNAYLSRNGRGKVDTVQSYQWDPKGNHLALAYGDATRSSVGLYQADQKMLLDIPTSVIYKDTPVIVWHKEGKGFDFVSTSGKDVYVLNRYVREKNLVSKVKALGGDEVAALRTLSPTYAK